MKRTLIATFALIATLAARAVEVSSVAELVSELESATADKEIVIASKAEPYDLSSVCMSRAGHLIANVRITLRGATGDPADVVLQGSTNRILYLAASGNSIRNITFKGGTCTNNVTNYSEAPLEYKRGGAICFSKWHDSTVVSNCVFVGNSAQDGGAVANNYNINKGDEQWGGRCLDCVFTNNVATTAGGAAYNVHRLVGCRLIGNRAQTSSGSAVCQAHLLEDCDFDDNGSYDMYYGAVYNIGTPATGGQAIRNCRFRRNLSKGYGAAVGSAANQNGGATAVEGCLFESNSVYYLSSSRNDSCGGAIYNLSNVSNCTFNGNSAGYGGAAYSSTLRGCRFIGNYINPFAQNWGGGGAAMNNCMAHGCTFTGNVAQFGAVAGYSSFVGCVISNNDTYVHTQQGRLTINCAFDSCRIMNVMADGGVIFAANAHVTNTLVAACTNAFLVGHNVDKNVSMVNCTVVSNSFANFASGYDNSGNMNVLNSLFFGNYKDFNNWSNATNCLRSISNSVFSATSIQYVPAAALEEGSGNFNYYGTAFDPRFVGAEVDAENPYALSLRSPCVKTYHGQVQDWMATANDIRGEGFPRLRDGVVDIGCYQCWLRPTGFIMVIR